LRQRKKIAPASFATNQDLTCPPADVSQFQRKNFAGSKPQSCQQEQDREITAPREGGPIRRTKDPANLLDCQLSGNTGLSPPTHGRNRGGQTVADLAVRVKKSQKGPETCGQQPDRLAGWVLRALKQKAKQHAGIQPTERSAAVLLLQVTEQERNQWQIDAE
jgi:hypothetical protein